MDYLETVQQKRYVDKDQQKLLDAVVDLRKAILTHKPTYTIKTDSKDYTTQISRLIRLLEIVLVAVDKIKPADTNAILKAIQNLKLDPVINVPEPNISVETPTLDFSPLKTVIKESMQPSGGIDLSRYRAVDIKEVEDVQYVGFINPEGEWYIIENDIKGNKMRYVFGKSAYSKHFEDCVGYKYKLLDKAINAAV